MVTVPDVVLHVERALRRAREQATCSERIAAAGQRVNPRLAGVRSQAGRDASAEPCGVRVLERSGHRTPFVRRWSAACDQQCTRGKEASSDGSQAAHAESPSEEKVSRTFLIRDWPPPCHKVFCPYFLASRLRPR